MLWVKIAVENREVYIVALYHPPKPINRTEIILARLEATVEILSQRPGADIILVGDFNGLGERKRVQRTELSPPIHTQTMGDNTLDRLFVSQYCYRIVRLLARVTVAGSSFVFAVVYRPGSATVTAAFFVEFRVLLEHLSSFATPYVITGDLNISFERASDPSTLRATELLEAFGAVQCVAGVTQDRGGTLDVVITREEDRPSSVDIITAPGGASDHRLVAWPFHAAQVEMPVYRTQRRRSWRQFDVEQFRADLQSSCLCDGFISSTLGEEDSLGDDASVMASRLDDVVTALLDAHAPMTEITCRVRRSSDGWYDSECRSAKRRARGRERRFKRSRTDAARDSWMRSLKTMHHLVRSKRKQFWRSRVDTGRDHGVSV